MASLDDVKQFFADRTDETSGISEVGNGAWSQAFSYRSGDQELIIRTSKSIENFLQDKHATVFTSEILPVPQVFEIGEGLDGYYAISERKYGSYLDDCNADEFKILLPNIFSTFKACKEADLSSVRGFGHWDKDGNGKFSGWKDFLLAVSEDTTDLLIHGWKDNLQKSKLGMSGFEELYASLITTTKELGEHRHLIHSDMLNYNVLVSENRISAILDWGSAKYGDFLYDLAWFVMYQKWYRSMDGIDLVEEATTFFNQNSISIPNMGVRIRACLIHIALDSVAFNSYKQDWFHAEEAIEHVWSVLESLNQN